MIISFIGFMGCGKSSVGRRLSELLCCSFMDLDSVIEEQAGRSIAEIFTSDGEAEFRRIELEALRSIIQAGTASERVPKQSLPSSMGPSLCGQRGSTVSEPSLMPRHCIVLALGGGAVMTPECAELVKENTLCIYLRTSVDTLVERLTDEVASRPLLNTGNQPTLRHRIETLMAQRASTYEATAHHIIDTDGLTIEEIAKRLVHILK
jgi:shikimate kinase